MAGARIDLEYDNRAVLARLQEIADKLESPAPLLHDLGEYGVASTQQRYRTQTAPDGTPWAALSPSYARRKARNRDKILTLRGYLRGSYRYQVEGSEVAWGTDLRYAAIHQFGGEIDMPARSQQAYFARDKAGEIGRLFVKKERSNFAQWISLGAHTIRIPARPALGISAEDEVEILALAEGYCES